MKITIQKQLEFNVEKERQRIEKCFSKDGFEKTKSAMIEIVDLFENREWENCIAKINSLGRNKIDECYEIEYVSMFIINFLDDIYPTYQVE